MIEKNLHRFILCSLSLFLFVASAGADIPPISDFGSETIEIDNALLGDDLLPLDVAEQPSGREGAPEEEVAEEGENVEPVIGDEAAANVEGDESLTTILNVKDVEIATLVKTFSKLTKRNYIVDSSVKGTITIHLTTPVTLDEALRIFDSVLLLKGFTTVPVENNTWKVIPAKDAKQTTVPLLTEPPDTPSDALVTEIFRLRHVAAKDLEQFLTQLISKEGALSSFEGTNSLMVIDSSANIARLRELVEILDVPARNQEITIIPVYHADANDIASKVNDILGTEEEASTGAQQPNFTTQRTSRRTSRQSARRGAAAAEVVSAGERTLPIKIIPDERTNSLIVVADPELTLKVKLLVQQLDTELDRSGGRFHVVRLKHADAETLGEIVNNLISGSTAETSPSEATATRGSSLTRSQTSREAIRQTGGLTLASASNNSGSNNGERTGRVNFDGDVSIAADPATNSLIINASRGDFQRIAEVIRELDVQRRQVLVEATILEVSLNTEEGIGIELQGSTGTDDSGIAAQTNFGNLTNLFSNPAALTDLTIAAASTGTLTLPGGLQIPSQALLVSAVSSNQNVNVLSSPTILSTDNEEAEIIVGENVPFVTSTSTDPSNLNNTFNQIDRQDVGITLRITPQISQGDFVTLRIFVEISNVVAGTRNDPNGPTTTIRTTETTVEVKSRQMIVTGGLIADNITESSRGVPFLMDIPVLGHLFKRNDELKRKTNLLVFITPTIVTDHYEARDSTREATGKLRSEIVSGGVTPDRDEILDNPRLDDVVELVPWERQPTVETPPSASQSTEATSEANKALERTQERVKQLLENQQKTEEDSPPSGPRIISVTPKLPGEEVVETEQVMKQTPLEKTTYVVLRKVGPPDSGEDLFTFADTKGTVGLIVSGSDAKTFQIGKRYQFGDKGSETSFVCLGNYPTPHDATQIHPALSELGKWNQFDSSKQLKNG